jgi:hypothetical protein
VCAALMEEGYELDDLVVRRYIRRWVVHWAAKNDWLPVVPPDNWREDLMSCLSSRIEHWQAEWIALGDRRLLPVSECPANEADPTRTFLASSVSPPVGP